MPYRVSRGKKGKTKDSCFKKKSSAKKRAKAIRKGGGNARVRKVKKCG